QAGLSAIALGAIGRHPVTSPAALRSVARLLPRLLTIAGWILLAGLALAGPPPLVAPPFAPKLLARPDTHHYLAEHPPEFLAAAIMIVIVAIPTVVAAVWLAVRWRLVVPVALCERGNALEALRSSVRLTRGHWRKVATAWLVTGIVVLGLGLLA